MKTNKRSQKSKDDVLKLDEISIIEKHLDNNKQDIDKFVFVCLTYGGFRASELTHMQRDWLHINDEYSVQLGLDYIQIPPKGQYCDCYDCKLQHFLEVEAIKADILKIKYTKEWYATIRKTFDYDNAEGRYWEPKTANGVRKIPVVYPVFKDVLLKFYSNTNQLKYSRQWVWGRINNISKDIWGSKTVFNTVVMNRLLYPHALRATAATLWAFKGMNATALKSIMGWSSIEIADIYVQSDEKQALLTAKGIAEKDNPQKIELKAI